MTSDPKQPDGGSDEPLDRKLREVLDETATAEPRGTPVLAHVTIEGYDIIRELHRGGQGVVYEAVQKSTKRKVAIKILLEGRFASSSARRRFQREITLAAGLKHPNIITIFDSGETPDGHQFCVMDYVRGRSIRAHVRQSKLALEETLELFCSVCEAAHFAHQKGVIHRDLKPSNILVDTDGVPKVLDFGLAKQLAGGTESLVSMTGQVMGTLEYMSPEQTRGNPDEIDARSDVYSLGVVLYELLTGQHPYPVKGHMTEVLKHITETEPVPPSKVWTADSGVSRRKSGRFRVGQCPIDDELRTILLKSLSKGRERRYQSAEALRQDIISYLADEPIEAKRNSSLYILKKSLHRHRGRIAMVIGFVVVAAVALYVGSTTVTREAPALALSGPITSLAVLPLVNLSGDPEQEYFADGMTGELITTMGKIKALKVISRMSVMQYKGTGKSPSEIARELNVDALVEGTVTRFGDRVRITANLIRAATSEQLWGDSYERDMRDVLGMQGEIARAIAREIRVKLTPQEQIQLARARSVNPEAYEAYLKGRSHFYKYSPEHFEIALEYFQLALEKNPNYAVAYVGIADVWGARGALGDVPPHEAFPKGKAAVLKALNLDDTLAQGHDILARFRFYYEWDWGGAETEFQRAIELNPNYADMRLFYSDFLRSIRRSKEALAQIERALELDPLNFYFQSLFGRHLLHLRRYDDAIAQFRKTLRTEPNFRLAHESLWVAFHQKRMDEKALAEAKKYFMVLGDSEVAEALAHGYAEAGYPGAMSLAAQKLVARSNLSYVPVMRIARLYAHAGEKDRALKWLEQAYEEREPEMVHLSVDLVWDTLRDEPRYKDLLRRMGLPPARAAGFSPRDRTTGDSPPPNGKIMLAVLPFEDMSPEPQEWFSDGMTEEMIAQLGRMQPKKLGVIARTSAMRYKNTTKGIDRIGRELSVEYILEGSVLRIGERVRITAQLIQVSDQTHLWGDTYDRTTQDVFAIQSDVARRVAGALAVTLLPEDQSTLDREPTTSSVAHDAYLKGLYHWNKRTESSLQRAIQFFESAVETDPDFALAHVGLALAHVVLAGDGYLAPTVAFARIKEEAEKAIALDETLGEAHLALALYRSYEWNHRGAEGEFREAIRLNPAHPTTHQWYAEFLVGQGRFEEALAQIKQAQHLDPASRIINAAVGMIYYRAHRFDEAVEQTLRALDFAPSFPYAHFVLGRCYAEMGLFEEAVAEINQAITLGERSIEHVAALGYACARAGRVDEARRIVDELHQRSQTQFVSEYKLAMVYVGLGAMDEAFRRLDRAFDQRALQLGWTLRVDPSFKSLHGDPRFDDLLRRIGLGPTLKSQSTAEPPTVRPSDGKSR